MAGLNTPLDDDVAKAVNSVTAASSPLMQQAQTDGLKVANRRGLLNSSMAAGHAQDAALRVAVPIGSQQAAQSFQKNLSAQGAAQQKDLQAAEITSREKLSGQELATRKELTTLELNQNTEQQGLNRGLQEKVAKQSADVADRNSSAQLVASLDNSYSNMIGYIMNNESLDAATREAQITSAKNKRDTNIKLVEQIYNIDLVWDGGSAGSPAVAPPPGFSEEAYLAKNPDVAAAIQAGTLASGLVHYNAYGRNEGRTW